MGPAGRGAASSAARAWRRRPEDRSRAGAGARGEWCSRRGGQGARPGALFGAGGVAAPGPCRTHGARPGTGGEWPFAPTAGSGVTSCDQEIRHNRDRGGEGLSTAQRSSFMEPPFGFLSASAGTSGVVGGGERRGRWGDPFSPFKMALTWAGIRRGCCQIYLKNKRQPAAQTALHGTRGLGLCSPLGPGSFIDRTWLGRPLSGAWCPFLLCGEGKDKK